MLASADGAASLAEHGRAGGAGMRRLPRPADLAVRLVDSLMQAFSRFINATFLGGSTRQSVSARAHIENWPARIWINRIFF